MRGLTGTARPGPAAGGGHRSGVRSARRGRCSYRKSDCCGGPLLPNGGTRDDLPEQSFLSSNVRGCWLNGRMMILEAMVERIQRLAAFEELNVSRVDLPASAIGLSGDSVMELLS